ncbi:hypothetical protein [Streptomyces sp. NBC_00258]|uniref:hypothetical protein n=1 Tax=Streptomyces sp. NBC_00258 TaxID=2903642 RepID=UPI002E29C12E|nr:hypothetical protein [Streptomyces sp. NBC_00258]
MSLTESENIFAGLNEQGLNTILSAVFTARPRLLNYRTSPSVAAVPASASSWTALPTIAFPGVPGGIDYAVRFSVPRVDLFPQSQPLPPALNLAVGQFSLQTEVDLILLCSRSADREGSGKPVGVRLGVAATGQPVVQVTGPGTGTVSFDLLAVEIVDITPDPLESLVECLVLTLLRAVLSSVALPFESLRAGAFSLNLLRGPETEDDQLKLYGAAV